MAQYEVLHWQLPTQTEKIQGHITQEWVFKIWNLAIPMKAKCTNCCIIKCGEAKRSVQILAAVVYDFLTEAAISYKMLLLMCKSAWRQVSSDKNH